MAAILLPLSGMWAAAQVDTPQPSLATGCGPYSGVFCGSNVKGYSPQVPNTNFNHPAFNEGHGSFIVKTDDSIDIELAPAAHEGSTSYHH